MSRSGCRRTGWGLENMALWARRHGQVFAPWHLLGAATNERVNGATVTAACGQNLGHDASMLELVDFEWVIGYRCPACDGVRWRTEPSRFQRTRFRSSIPREAAAERTVTAGPAGGSRSRGHIETGRSQLRKAVEALGPDKSHEIRYDPNGDPRFVVAFRRAGQRYFLVGGADEREALRNALDWVDQQSAGRVHR